MDRRPGVFEVFDVLDRRKCRPSLGQRLAWLAGGVVLGSIAAYLADPDRGRERRADLQEQGARLAAQAADLAAGTTDPALSGAAGELTPDMKDPSDAVLIERVRSDAIGPSTVRNSAIVTTVEGGVVTVRGQVDERGQREDLLGRIRGVDGVEDVVDLTHLPDEPAPTRS
jgi:osmotically-inducible protein OsmY